MINGVLLGVLIWVLSVAAAAAVPPSGWQSDYGVGAPVIRFEQGGIVDRWLALGPFPSPPLPPMGPGRPTRNGYDFDFLQSLGGEAAAVLDSTSVIFFSDQNVRPVRARMGLLSATEAGTVDFAPLFLECDNRVAYAFCFLACNRSRQARCFFGADGGARVWINHRPVYGRWSDDEPYRGPVDWFDVELAEGLNPVLVKVDNGRGAWRFGLQMYDRVDSLAAMLRQVDTLLIAVDSAARRHDDSLAVTLRFDLPLPPGRYRGGLAILSGGGDTLVACPASNDIPCVLPVRAAAGGVRLVGWIETPHGVPLRSERWIWRGDLAAVLDSLALRRAALPAGERLSLAKRRDGGLVSLLYRRCGAWFDHWLVSARGAGEAGTLRQLTYASDALSFLEALAQGRPPRGGMFVPLLFRFGELPADTAGYDPARWLSYKYPQAFSPPARVGGGRAYSAWMYLPPQWAGRGRLPLLCALHDERLAGEGLDRIRHFGPAGYVEAGNALSMAVLQPQCPAGTWWDAVLLNAIIDEIVQSGGIDQRRITIAGAGIGGFGVWHLCALYGARWAAAVSVSAAGDEARACGLPRLPLRVFHGGRDTVVTVSQAAAMVESLKRCGWRGIEFSVFAEAGHEIWPVVFGSPELYAWLLSKRR